MTWKKILLGAVAAALLAAPTGKAHAQQLSAPTYVAVATITPGGAGANVFAFQNTSSSLDVTILRVEVANANTGAAGGGLAQYSLFGATALTAGGTSQVGAYGLRAANQAALSGISVSTGPVSITFETTGGGTLPLARPMYVNSDKAATTNLWDRVDFDQAKVSAALPLTLPHGGNRAIVLQQGNLNNAAVTTGLIQIRVVYSVQ